MSTPKLTMTRAEIRTELGWSDDMIYSLLQNPDSTKVRRCKNTGGYTSGHYYRDRVLAIAQSTEGRPPKSFKPTKIPMPSRLLFLRDETILS